MSDPPLNIIRLYTTLGCHLCEQAKAMVLPLLQRYSCELVEVEIGDSKELMDAYGLVIPVLENQQSRQSLRWPFQSSDIERLLQS